MSDPSGDAIDRRTTTTTTGHGTVWLPLLLAVLLVPLLVGGAATYLDRVSIEDALTDKATQALHAAGLDTAVVAFEGRDATVTGVPSGQESAAQDVLDNVDGVRVVDVATGGQQPLTIAVAGRKVTLGGSAPGGEAQRQFTDAVAAALPGNTVTGTFQETQGATFPADAQHVAQLVQALGNSAGHRSLAVTESGLSVSGDVPSASEQKNIEDRLRTAGGGAQVRSTLSVEKGAAKQNLQDRLREKLAAQPVTFEPDAAQLTPEGEQAVRTIAEALQAAPGIRVEVAGHVADLPGDAEGAMQLSQQRAAAVVDQLVAAGIARDRLVAQGYGGTKPVAGNDTPEGQAANRRVEIAVL
ncbi:OmpA family protein [Pseudonocardiaceae bacterium YIM PH 21723]|nr:OmpA family protein [Pseudonocardiaceae bacterium YIM PH 21723]